MIPVNFSDVAEKVRAGVVNVQVTKKVKNLDFGPRDFFGARIPLGTFSDPFTRQPSSPVFSSRESGPGL